ncbi:MAG: UDP-N-acetylmuramoyl-L-alanyl-D-glutamate--2,6-diaminopimelate ligase [Candidatus Bipolaricaulota bacterium]
MNRHLEELLSEVDRKEFYGERDQLVTGISCDSRSIKPGYAFVAISGEKANGHDFIDQALKKGTKVVFGEKPYSELTTTPPTYIKTENARETLARLSHAFFGKPTNNLYTVGITGTNGKTTTVHLTKKVLGEEKSEIISTITNKEIPGTKRPVTTPESPEIHEIAGEAIKNGKENFILEVSSHSLSLERVTAVEFNCGVFTNLTRDHLDYHDSLEAYKEEKMKLFRYLTKEGTAVVNGDEEFSEEIEKEADGEVIQYGLDKTADVIATDIKKSKKGNEFVVLSPWGTQRIKTDLFGIYNVYNTLAAITVGLNRGIDLARIGRLLESVKGIRGRMEKLELTTGADIYIDFAHNSGAIEQILRELSQLYPTTSIVFGCGGESDKGKRPEMGRVASKYANRIFITDDNPKSEDRMEILSEIQKGIKENSNYSVIPDRKTAIEKAIDELKPESCLLIAGKGHEQYQIVSDNWISHNDKEFVEKICREKSLIQ